MTFTYSFSENRVYCMTFYAGKTVKGVAKRDPEDEFDLEVGKKLARARCEYKVAKAKYKRKTDRRTIADKELIVALEHASNALKYQTEAYNALEEAEKNLKELESSLR